MSTIHEIKRLATPDTPVILFDCELTTGAVERWSTHRVTVAGNEYDARVIKHDAFDIRSASDGGIDTASRLSVTFANADSVFSQIARLPGFKGAKLTARFVFVNENGVGVCDPLTIFRGVANAPDEISEAHARITFSNRMSMQRVLLPQVRIQRRCAWMFPGTTAQREEAVAGGGKDLYSPFYRCGYSAGQAGGVGNLNGGSPFVSCDYTRGNCVERGMFDKDSAQTSTKRFGGIEFVPSSILVKSYGEKGSHTSAPTENAGKYNDFVPLVYGTAWYRPAVIFARNDGNLTHLEVLLGMGQIQGVVKVVVNGFELPAGSAAQSPASTGWFNVVNYGGRNGAFNPDFGGLNPEGDPYGSMAVASVVVPTRISDGASLPRIEVLVEGLKLPIFDLAGAQVNVSYTNNPAWVMLDVLRRSGWDLDEIDLVSFAATAEYCGELITTSDLNGNTVEVPRFQTNLVVRQRRSAADLVRGLRNSSALQLTYGAEGKVRLSPESALAVQQPTKPITSNSLAQIAGGWPAYEFGDGSNGFTDVIRRDNGAPSVKIWSRSTAECPNRYTVEFQDQFNGYQQDSLSLSDIDDTVAAGQEVSANLPALGIPNFNQAGRILRLFLDRSIRGNTYIQFETGLRSIGLAPGELITFTYAKEGLTRQLFRIVSVSPSLNLRSAAILAQWHEDSWYVGGGGETSLLGGGRQPVYEVNVPRPLLGTEFNADDTTRFGIEESIAGESTVSLRVSYTAPGKPSAQPTAVPFVSLSPLVQSTGGTLKGGRTYYYAISAMDIDGNESSLSFTVRAVVPSGQDTNTVRLKDLSFAPSSTAFRVYRGDSPSSLFRIAGAEVVGSTYVDIGAAIQLASPPDQNYDHANVYWRAELQPPYNATLRTALSIGNASLGMLVNEYRGKVVRLESGRGAGQERTVVDNDATTLTLQSAWGTAPDAATQFSVSEAGWNLGAISFASPAVFSVPARTNATVQVTGLAANVHNKECALELSPVTRHQVGGSGDADVPVAPGFGLFAAGDGTVEISGVAFTDTTNTHSILAATCVLHFWNELTGIPALSLVDPAAVGSTELNFNSAQTLAPGSLLQVGAELMLVQTSAGAAATVERAVYGTSEVAHPVGNSVFVLNRKLFIMPFARGFFGSAASGSYQHRVTLPNVRIAAAQMFVTNSFGNSETSAKRFTNTIDEGLRTYSGGQYSLQIEGRLAMQSDAAPKVTIDSARSVRDIFARVRTAPTGGVLQIRLTVDGSAFCLLEIADGETSSLTIDGLTVPYLASGSQLGIDILTVGGAGSLPPSDLSVTVRL